jgi:hypothetical protein
MSAHGGRRGPGTGGPPPLAWALLVIAAALVGGLAAAALVHTSLVIAVIVAVVIGGIAVAVFRSPAASLPPAASRPPAAPLSHAASLPHAAPPAPATAAPPTDAVVQLLPLQAQPGENSSRPAGQSWWDAAAGASPPPPSPAAQRAPAPDLSTYLASTFIAQCPRCGAFRLDIRRTPDRWDFRCESCEYLWAWQPGTPWPPVRVMPARRRE